MNLWVVGVKVRHERFGRPRAEARVDCLLNRGLKAIASLTLR